jgi:hypothetical protein
MSDYLLSNSVATKEDWEGTWQVTTSDSTYLPEGTTLMIDLESDIVLVQSPTLTAGTFSQLQMKYLEGNGDLQITGVSDVVMTSSHGVEHPPGTSFVLAGSLLFFINTAGDLEKRMIGLAFVGDPEDAGVMAAESQ